MNSDLFILNNTQTPATITQNKNISELSEDTLESFQELFYQAFNHTMSKKIWRWKYLLSPAHSLGFWTNNQLEGHYGGFVRNILFLGQNQKAIQVGDTMTAPGVRGLLTKNGVFNQLATAFLHRYIGFNAPYLLGFGFPTTRVMKLAERLGLYYHAGSFTRLVWTVPKQTHASLFYKIRPVLNKDHSAIDQLWLKMAKQCQQFIIGERDWQRINYRYITSPLHDYMVLKINNRLTNQLIAIVILKFEGDECLIVDLISSLTKINVIIDCALRFASLQKKTSLSILISDNLRFLFSKKTYTENNPEISIPHCACTEGPSLELVKDKWWLMAGDSDCM